MTSVLRFLARLLLVSAGLVFAASLTVVFVVLLAAWSLRAGWARLTGRRVSPFIMRMGPRSAFSGFMRRAAAAPARRPAADVTDVEIKAMR